MSEALLTPPFPYLSCVQCPLGQVPNSELTACRPIVPSHLDWDSPSVLPHLDIFGDLFAIINLFLPSVGLLSPPFSPLSVCWPPFSSLWSSSASTTPPWSLHSQLFNSEILSFQVMASGRELCYCMLCGIAFCYLMTFVLVSRPSELVSLSPLLPPSSPFFKNSLNSQICTLTRLLPGMSMATVYAAVLVKTNRLVRVFKPNNALRPRWIGPIPQANLKIFS